ncbi:DUF5040 domain-containing protein [Dysgonomonas sp. 520]|uniref:DUF5040 domain-containing protein n=1 Tax=Dysgonomonas sp. 520 TaxID=2302931 RepID=UPI0013D2D68C|nr:DUF5040 domain-containing protein [Dysgonomonas sp. 520]NDW10171.1 DUF5040 domain-containing protein [Dysgonomonas sp. 520]
MKKKILLFILLLSTVGIIAQTKHTFMLTGASFAVKENGWFELGCEAFDAKPINKSVSGQAILQTAMGMYNGTFYTKAELEETDVFVIMHVHNQNVANTEWIKDDYTEYTYSAISTNYPIAYDYVIKKYKDDCLKLKDDPTSKYFGLENGKPALIMLCTHWHDSRTIYNPAIRTLAERWNLPLVKWDENIGFSRKDVASGEVQPSRQYAGDTENIGGVIYGWHPLRGKGQYIQQKMASIFIEEMEKIMGEIPVTVRATAKNSIIIDEDEAYASFAFTGVSPWNLTYEINGKEYEIKDINQSPLLVKIEDIVQGQTVTVEPTKVSNASTQGTVSGSAVITFAQENIAPFFDTFVHNANTSKTYMDADSLELKTSTTDNYSREAFVSFKFDDLIKSDDMVMLRLFFGNLIYSVSNPPIESHLIEVAGNLKEYATMTWATKPTDFTPIAETTVEKSELGSFISWDVTDWVQEQIQAGATKATFRLKVKSGGTGLFRFPSIDSSSPNKPALLTVKKISLDIGDQEAAADFRIYPNPFADYITIANAPLKNVSIFSLDGNCVFRTSNLTSDRIDTASFPAGMYIVSYETQEGNVRSEKIVK